MHPIFSLDLFSNHSLRHANLFLWLLYLRASWLAQSKKTHIARQPVRSLVGCHSTFSKNWENPIFSIAMAAACTAFRRQPNSRFSNVRLTRFFLSMSRKADKNFVIQQGKETFMPDGRRWANFWVTAVKSTKRNFVWPCVNKKNFRIVWNFRQQKWIGEFANFEFYPWKNSHYYNS